MYVPRIIVKRKRSYFAGILTAALVAIGVGGTAMSAAAAPAPAPHHEPVAAAAPAANMLPMRPPPGADCKSGYACIFPGKIDNHNPSYRFYDYGTYPIYNVFGSHLVYNHQTGGAHMYLCDHRSCPDPRYSVPAGKMKVLYLRPINYVKIAP